MRFDFPLSRQQIAAARAAVLQEVPLGSFQISTNGVSTLVVYVKTDGIESAITRAISQCREESVKALAEKRHAKVTSAFGAGFTKTANARSKSKRRQGIK